MAGFFRILNVFFFFLLSANAYTTPARNADGTQREILFVQHVFRTHFCRAETRKQRYGIVRVLQSTRGTYTSLWKFVYKHRVNIFTSRRSLPSEITSTCRKSISFESNVPVRLIALFAVVPPTPV